MILNLTPHIVNLRMSDGTISLIERKGRIPRVEEVIEFQDLIEGSYVYGMSYGGVIDAPPIVPNTIYIVSRMVAEALPSRDDLLFPIMLERDDKGTVISARGLGRIVNVH